MRFSRTICDGRSLEKRSASRQIDTRPFATVSPGRVSLLRDTIMRYVTAILMSSLFGTSYGASTWLFEASGGIAGPVSRFSSNERTISFTGKNIDGIPSSTSFIAETPPLTFSNGFDLQLSTRKTTRILEPGIYLLAQRAGFEPTGYPGLDVSIDGNGCNTLYGEFTILRYELDASGKPLYVDVTFRFLCGENQTIPTIGRFAYDAAGSPISFVQAQPAVPVPTASIAAVTASSLVLLLFGSNFLMRRRSTSNSRSRRTI